MTLFDAVFAILIAPAFALMLYATWKLIDCVWRGEVGQ